MRRRARKPKQEHPTTVPILVRGAIGRPRHQRGPSSKRQRLIWQALERGIGVRRILDLVIVVCVTAFVVDKESVWFGN